MPDKLAAIGRMGGPTLLRAGPVRPGTAGVELDFMTWKEQQHWHCDRRYWLNGTRARVFAPDGGALRPVKRSRKRWSMRFMGEMLLVRCTTRTGNVLGESVETDEVLPRQCDFSNIWWRSSSPNLRHHPAHRGTAPDGSRSGGTLFFGALCW